MSRRRRNRRWCWVLAAIRVRSLRRRLPGWPGPLNDRRSSRRLRRYVSVHSADWGLSGVVAVLVQVREQEHSGKRERADNGGNPCPAFEAASTTLGKSARKVHRSDKSDQGDDVHDERADAALR